MMARFSPRTLDDHPAFVWLVIALLGTFVFALPAFCQDAKSGGPVQDSRQMSARDFVLVDSQNNDLFEADEIQKTDSSDNSEKFGISNSVEVSERPEVSDRWFFNTRIGQRIAGRLQSTDIRKRPMMYWRRFADRKPAPIATFAFLLFFNTTVCLVFRKRVKIASDCVRRSFWKSLGAGMIFVLVLGTAARLCFDSQLFTPLAIAILAAVQFLGVCGLAVSSRTVGEAILSKFSKKQTSTMETTQSHTALTHLAPVFLGTVVFALIVLIPGVGPLPRLGTRFLMWLGLLGLGALVRTKFGRKVLD